MALIVTVQFLSFTKNKFKTKFLTDLYLNILEAQTKYFKYLLRNFQKNRTNFFSCGFFIS